MIDQNELILFQISIPKSLICVVKLKTKGKLDPLEVFFEKKNLKGKIDQRIHGNGM